jgi:phage shock protein C
MENTSKKLCRSRNERMLAGVCGGIADYFNVDPTIVRLAFVLLALAGGPGLIFYIILALIIPEEQF